MKLRQGFVSNSSSCSFTIKVSDLNRKQVEQLIYHINWWNTHKMGDLMNLDDAWEIKLNISEERFEVSTLMDNFPMMEYLSKIKVNPEKIRNFEHSDGGELQNYYNEN